MDSPPLTTLRIGDWSVDPTSREISRGTDTIRVEERTMRLLLCLAEGAGQVISVDELLTRVWPGVIVTPDSVYQAVASLRRLLGDDPKRPAYIVTVPRLGYRMVAAVQSPGEKTDRPAVRPPFAAAKSKLSPSRIVGVVLVIGCLAYFWFSLRYSDPPPVPPSTAGVGNPRSIAVLPFLDLTEEMKEEVFADGMTEELIDKLSKIKGLRVPPPTSSFFFKGKKIALADIARSLGVSYVLDGSVRKSGATFRVAARLIRADDGYVVWSETYDRPVDDKLMVQDDIAGEVTKALRNSIG